jgi:hypothetical protein
MSHEWDHSATVRLRLFCIPSFAGFAGAQPGANGVAILCGHIRQPLHYGSRWTAIARHDTIDRLLCVTPIP